MSKSIECLDNCHLKGLRTHHEDELKWHFDGCANLEVIPLSSGLV